MVLLGNTMEGWSGSVSDVMRCFELTNVVGSCCNILFFLITEKTQLATTNQGR